MLRSSFLRLWHMSILYSTCFSESNELDFLVLFTFSPNPNMNFFLMHLISLVLLIFLSHSKMLFSFRIFFSHNRKPHCFCWFGLNWWDTYLADFLRAKFQMSSLKPLNLKASMCKGMLNIAILPSGCKYFSRSPNAGEETSFFLVVWW